MVGAGAIMMRRFSGTTDVPSIGAAPEIPDAEAQNVMTLKMPNAVGWEEGHVPDVAPGLTVNAFATELRHPRWIYVLPNNDVLVAESMEEKGVIKSAFDYAIYATMKRARAVGTSANRISIFRDSDGDGVAESRSVFVKDQNRPFGMALVDGKFYIGNTDGVVAFNYNEGDDHLEGNGKRLVDFKPLGHWTRSLLPSSDGSKLYAGVGH